MATKKPSKKSNPQKGKKRIQVDFTPEFITMADEKGKKRHMKRKQYIEYAAMQFVKND